MKQDRDEIQYSLIVIGTERLRYREREIEGEEWSERERGLWRERRAIGERERERQ